VLLWVVNRAIVAFGYARTHALVQRSSPAPTPKKQDRRTAEAIARTVSRVASPRRFDTSCLRQCLATEWLLRWKRIPVDFRMGARTEDGVWSGHAWLEHQGPLLPADADAPRSYEMRWDGV